MKLPAVATPYIAAATVAAIAAIAVAMWVKKKGVAGVAADVVGAAGEAASGVVVGVGQLVGIPATNETECDRARREGRTWDASFACPAGTFMRYLVSPAPAPRMTTGDFARLDRQLDASYGQAPTYDFTTVENPYP